ncbi:DUF2793 domain-containing protein [Hoeflea sp.]|uniref:DUF2793 domain-containing protein n=1 Tax=Hoeflea sp. TaxID=1940281 RepID=UPI003A935B6C
MDRINGAGTIDIGGGRRGFRSEDLPTGTEGTEVTDLFLNMVQEEIIKVIEDEGIVLNPADWTQLSQALARRMAGRNARAWVPVVSMTITDPPGAPAAGDIYLVPDAATGDWAANVGKIAEWTGAAWAYSTPPNGHGISLPDGRVFERIGGAYVEKIALDVQSGKWSYAEAGGTANAVTITLDPAPSSLASLEGSTMKVKFAAQNTGPMTINPNGLADIPLTRVDGIALAGGEVGPDQIWDISYDGTNCQLLGYSSLAAKPVNSQSFIVSGTFIVPEGVSFVRASVRGGGGGGGGATAAASAGGGGGGAEYRSGWFAVTPGDAIAVTIGSGGAGGVTDGTAGGASSFGPFVTANGGAGGLGGVGAYGGGVGGSGGFGGTESFEGSTGASASVSGSLAVSGRGGAPYALTGAHFVISNSAGIGGRAGPQSGSGGGGGVNGGTGGNGGNGRVDVEWG